MKETDDKTFELDNVQLTQQFITKFYNETVSNLSEKDRRLITASIASAIAFLDISFWSKTEIVYLCSEVN